MVQTVLDQSVPDPIGQIQMATYLNGPIQTAIGCTLVPLKCLGYSSKRSPLPPLNAAQQRLVQDNMRLACWLARQAGRNANTSRMPDLIQTAIMAMCRAAQRWDPARGIAFGTYASPACRRAVRDDINEHLDVIDLPRWLFRKDGVGHPLQVHLAQARRVGRFTTANEPLELQTDEHLDVEALLAWLPPDDCALLSAWLGGEKFRDIAARLGGHRHKVAQSVHRIIGELRVRAEAIG
jgi:RNA polymerase sigma factor (sigma-70 family)